MRYFDRSLYRSPVHYGLCLTDKEYRKECARLHVPKEQVKHFIDHGAAMTHILEGRKQGSTVCIVCIHPISESKKPLHVAYGLLVHEAVHVFQEMMEHMGEKNPSSEFMAYGIQQIATNLIADFIEVNRRHTKPKKQKKDIAQPPAEINPA